MRHLVCLVGCALVLSCTVNSSNLDVDAAAFGTGGQQAGTGGVHGTGGIGGNCPRCVDGTGGQIATGGQVGTGGQLATGGQLGTGGQGGNHGGEGGTSGQGAAGQSGAGGQGGGNQTCADLQAQYTSALAAARACNPDRPGQCQQRVDTSVSCKTCQTYVNDTTELDAIAASWSAAGCDQMHTICPLACVSPQPSHCAGSNAAQSGGGTCTTNAGP